MSNQVRAPFTKEEIIINIQGMKEFLQIQSRLDSNLADKAIHEFTKLSNTLYKNESDPQGQNRLSVN